MMEMQNVIASRRGQSASSTSRPAAQDVVRRARTNLKDLRSAFMSKYKELTEFFGKQTDYQEVDLRSLSCRLDFNEYYSRRGADRTRINKPRVVPASVTSSVQSLSMAGGSMAGSEPRY